MNSLLRFEWCLLILRSSFSTSSCALVIPSGQKSISKYFQLPRTLVALSLPFVVLKVSLVRIFVFLSFPIGTIDSVLDFLVLRCKPMDTAAFSTSDKAVCKPMALDAMSTIRESKGLVLHGPQPETKIAVDFAQYLIHQNFEQCWRVIN